METSIVETTTADGRSSEMARLRQVRRLRNGLSERRLALRREQALFASPEIRASLHALDVELRSLEDEERALRSTILFGSREAILERARRDRQLMSRRKQLSRRGPPDDEGKDRHV